MADRLGSSRPPADRPRRTSAPRVDDEARPRRRPDAEQRPDRARRSQPRDKPRRARESEPDQRPRRRSSRDEPPARRGGKERPRAGFFDSRRNVVIVAGAGAGLLVIVIVVLILVLGGSPDRVPGDKTFTVKAEQGAAAVNSAKAGAPKASAAEHAALRTEFDAAKREADAKKLFDIAQRSRGNGMEDLAVQAATEALKLKPDSEQLHQFLGHKYYKMDPLLLDADFDFPDLVDRMRPDHEKWFGTDKEWQAVKAREIEVIAEIKGARERLKSNPTQQYAQQIRNGIENNAALKGYQFEYVFTPHYVIAVEKDDKMNFKNVVKNREAMFEQLYEEFNKVYVERFQLVKQYPWPFVALVFKDFESYRKYSANIGLAGLPRGVLAYYHRLNKYIALYEGEDSIDTITADGVVFHEGTHQLIDGHRPEKAEESSLWFQEGIAEYWGSVESTGERKWALRKFSKSRAEEYWVNKNYQRFHRSMAKEDFPIAGVEIGLRELLDLNTKPDVRNIAQRRVRKVNLEQFSTEIRDRVEGFLNQKLSSGLYAASWSFFYFCYNFENGKYAAKMDEYIKAEFSGDSGYFVFKKVFKIDSDQQLQDLEKEWHGFVASDILPRAVPDEARFLKERAKEVDEAQKRQFQAFLEQMKKQQQQDGG